MAPWHGRPIRPFRPTEGFFNGNETAAKATKNEGNVNPEFYVVNRVSKPSYLPKFPNFQIPKFPNS
jgi:hypothetical protein